jgi:hypothetical protein
MVRAKFRCVEKRSSVSNYGSGPKPVEQEAVVLQPVAGPGNEEWSKYTPSGKLEMVITNPAAVSQFAVGQDYILTFEPAE